MAGKYNLKTILLIVLAVFATAFAFMNYKNPVWIWPFGTFRVIWAILISFGLGIGVGALGQNLLGLLKNRRERALEGIPETEKARKR